MTPPMFGLNVRKMKEGFFDRAAVTLATDQATIRVLSKFGAFVRTAARSLIRTRKKPSMPGSPPHGHVGLLRRFIFFSFDRSTRSVVIGPARLNGRAYADAPIALEYGGRFRRFTNSVLRLPFIATYPARPFMNPAYRKELPKLPRMWKNSISKP